MRRANFGCQSFHLFLRFFFFSFHSSFYTPHPPRWTSASISNAHVKCRQFLLPHLLQRTYNWPLSATVFKSSATPPFKTCERICNHDFRNLHIQSYIYTHMSHIYILYTYIYLYTYIHTYIHMNKHHMLKFPKIRKVSSIAAAAAWAVTPQDTAPWCRVVPGSSSHRNIVDEYGWASSENATFLWEWYPLVMTYKKPWEPWPIYRVAQHVHPNGWFRATEWRIFWVYWCPRLDLYMLYPFEAHDIGIFCSYGCVGTSFFSVFFDTRWLWPWIVGKMMIHHGMLWVHVHHVPDVLENWEWSADGQSIHGQFYVFFLNGTNSWLHHKMGSHIYNL